MSCSENSQMAPWHGYANVGLVFNNSDLNFFFLSHFQAFTIIWGLSRYFVYM